MILGLATAAAAGCFEQHLLEAMALNSERRALYAEFSGGRSEAVSDRLVETERLTLPVARAFDRRAETFQRAGIAVMCAEFEPMSRAPGAPTQTAPMQTPPGLVEWVQEARLAVRFEAAYTEGGFAAAERLAGEVLSRLAEAEPRGKNGGLCMTRHLVESIRRVARLAPHHAGEADLLGFRWRSPERLSRAFYWLQVAALPAGLDLDVLAEPAHLAGAPIICSDVPPIP